MIKSMIGIDIGSSSLKIAQCKGGVVTALAEEPMPDKLAWNGRIVSAEAMAEFLKKTLRENRIRGRHCTIVLPSSQVYVRKVVLPLMTDTQLRLNLPYEFRDFITEEKDKYYYDYAILQTIPADGVIPGRQELFVSAAPKELVTEYINVCRWAGLKLDTVIPMEAAYANLFHKFGDEEERQEEKCVVDVGHTGTRVYFYVGERFEALRDVERGGAALDDLLADTLSVDKHIAHARKEGNAEGELEMAETQVLLAEIATDVMRSVNFYSYNNQDSSLKTGWLCGGGSRIAPLRAELDEALGMELHPISDLIGEGFEDSLACACFAAIGAAVQEQSRRRQTKRTLNLMQAEKSSLRPSRSIPSVAAVLALTALFGKFAVADRLSAASAAEARAAAKERELAQVQEQLLDYDAVEAEYSRYFSDALGTAREEMPLGAVEVLELLNRQLVGRAAVISMNFSGKTITLEMQETGLTGASELIASLYGEPAVAGVEVAAANNGRDTEGDRIRMTITLQEVDGE